MSTKTGKVLHVIAFILIVLTMAFVLLGWLVFKDKLMLLVGGSVEMMSVDVVPLGAIIEVGFILLLALIWLLVLLAKPGRGATIAMTIILAVLLIGYFAVGKAFLNAWLQQRVAAEGAMNLAAYSQFNYVLTTIMNFAFVPGVILMILSLGSACGKNFKPEEEPEQEPERPVYTQRPAQAAQQNYAGRPQYSQSGYGQQNYGQQNYGQQPKPQNAGYAPKQDAVTQNTGYIPKVDVPQNTGYIPKVEVPQNTGYIPKVDAAQNTGVIPPVKPAQESAGTAGQVIYPWMKAAGAPVQNNVEMSPQKAEEAAELVSETPESGE